jgi:hypothetical protein
MMFPYLPLYEGVAPAALPREGATRAPVIDASGFIKLNALRLRIRAMQEEK